RSYAGVADRRAQVTLASLLTLAVTSVLCGCHSLYAIVQFGRAFPGPPSTHGCTFGLRCWSGLAGKWAVGRREPPSPRAFDLRRPGSTSPSRAKRRPASSSLPSARRRIAPNRDG